MSYEDCKHYDGGYCELVKNGLGINLPCCERNDCPDYLKGLAEPIIKGAKYKRDKK